jgi:protein-arginine kinase activator protein McsA
MPKEIFVTEVKEDAVRHLYMCRMCGDEYIKNLADADVVTKSLEVVSSDGNVSHNERVIQEGKDEEELRRVFEEHLTEDEASETETPATPPSQRFNKIKAVEAKMQDAIDREDYESAAKLRDILKLMLDESEDQTDA